MTGTGLVVVAGGAARRAGGVDKAMLVLDGRSLLARVLDAGTPAVVVGPVRPGFSDVTWTREHPVGSGPLAAVAAGQAALPKGLDRVLVVGGDMPYVARAKGALHDSLGSSDVALLVDAHGHDQPLAALWRRTSLVRALGLLPPTGAPLRMLFEHADVARVPDRWEAARDVDTLDDLTRLEGRP